MPDIDVIIEKGLPFYGHYEFIDLICMAGGPSDVWLAIDMNTVDAQMMSQTTKCH